MIKKSVVSKSDFINFRDCLNIDLIKYEPCISNLGVGYDEVKDDPPSLQFGVFTRLENPIVNARIIVKMIDFDGSDHIYNSADDFERKRDEVASIFENAGYFIQNYGMEEVMLYSMGCIIGANRLRRNKIQELVERYKNDN